MEQFWDKLLLFAVDFWDRYLRHAIDILVVAYIFYWAFMFLSRTRAMQILKGLLGIAVLFGLAYMLKLNTLIWLIEHLTLYGVVTLIILFQPELRRLITQFGQRHWFAGETNPNAFPLEEVVNAVEAMAEEKVGSLMVIERSTGLKSYIESGVDVDAVISEEFIRTIFYPMTPLHDGAIIIRKGRIVAAACYLPLSDSRQLKKHHGARHRAGLGIAEETDALVLVTSEETGNISIMVNGKFFSKIKTTDLKNMILYFLNPKTAYEETYRIK